MAINGKAPGKSDGWRTPDWLFDQLSERFDFEVDAAASVANAKCFKMYEDGLASPWTQRTFCNPPFSNKAKWIKKAHDEVLHGDCPLCVMILPNCIDTKAFNKYIHGKFHWEHLPYRVAFEDETGKPIKGNPSGTIIVYFWKLIVRSK